MKAREFRSGQMAIVLTLAIATLLGVMALGTDVGVMYYNWVQLQKAADAAAIAGASQLTGQPDATNTISGNAKAYAAGYACLNGLNDPNAASDAGVSGAQQTVMTNLCSANASNNPRYTDSIASINVDSNNSFVRIALTRQFPYYFGSLIGLTNANVAAAAKATVSGNVGTVTGGLFPAGVQCATDASGNCKFSCNPVSASCNNLPAAFNKDQIFAGTQASSSYAPGNWGWLNLGVSTGCTAGGGPYAQAIGCGGSTSESITSVLTKPGSTTGQIRQGWTFRDTAHNTFVQNNPACNISYSSICGGTATPCTGDPLAVVVPIVNFNAGSGCNGLCSLAVAGFAELYLDPTQSCIDPGNGNSNKSGCGGVAALEGCFVQSVAPDTISSSTAPATGVTSAPVLVQ
jgi:Flp pilus assembly protein TadG